MSSIPPCAACGSSEVARLGVGGLVLCRLCADEFRAEADALRPRGAPVDVARFVRVRREAFCVTLSPRVVQEVDRVRGEEPRSRWIEEAIRRRLAAPDPRKEQS